jgi:fused signal recognition particle receptor
MFQGLKERIRSFKKRATEEIGEDSRGLKKITIQKLENLWGDFEIGLLESDVALPVVEELRDSVIDDLMDKRVGLGTSIQSVIDRSLKKTIESILISPDVVLEEMIQNKKPLIIMFVGVNGSGKTTAIAKLAWALKGKGYSSVVAASDTFRAGAIEQLEKHCEKLGLKLIKHKPGGDPAAVAYDAIEYAKAHGTSAVLIDTAGRMQTNVNLMAEMEKIKRVAKPDLTIFVGDAMTGNDAIDQAEKFNDSVGIDGIILTKIDSDVKGGAALSIGSTIKRPILFLGTGQGYGDLVPFDKSWFIERLFS